MSIQFAQRGLSQPAQNRTSSIRSSTAWTVAIVACGTLAWVGALLLMGGMDQGPGTAFHSFPMFVASWAVMLTAMMLPSEIVYVRTFAGLLERAERFGNQRERRVYRVLAFMTGYAIAWLGYGSLAYVGDLLLRKAALEFTQWQHQGPLISGAVLVAAGAYQVSAWKQSCLSHCRSPVSFFARSWRPGVFGALQMGVCHGLICIACCWALMAVMFAVGLMNMTWMAVLTLFMFVEKILPFGHRLAWPIACLLFLAGSWIAIAPGSIPQLLLVNPLLAAHSGDVDAIKLPEDARVARHPLVGQPAPAFSLARAEGGQVTLRELNADGPVIIVFYYGFHCGHCVGQLLTLHDEIERFRQRQVSIVALSADPPEVTQRKLARYGPIDFPLLSDPVNQTAISYGVVNSAEPAVGELRHGLFVVDREGKIVKAYCGAEPYADVAALMKLLDALDLREPTAGEERADD